MSDTLDATLDATVAPQASQPPNFVALPLENFQAAIVFINQNLPTGLGVPLLERLGRNIGLHMAFYTL